MIDQSTAGSDNLDVTRRRVSPAAPPAAAQIAAVISMDAEPLTIIDNRFVLEQRIGGGGMGVVYRARDKLMERHRDRDPYVALKLISEGMRANAEARLLLQRECSRAQKLSHPNIIRVFYFGCDEQTDSDYLTMELLLGESLERLILENPYGVEWERSSKVIEQLCSGLEYAHSNGIVHSDIKPSNLFITESATLKILDFGIAARLRTADAASSETLFNPRRSGAVSERYSSLEMHLGLDADPSDDVFSAACVIYELLTGQHPYQLLRTPQAAHENLKPAPVAALNAAQNRALRKALNFRRAERTATIAELKNGLLHSARPMPKARIWIAASAVAVVLTAAAISLGLDGRSKQTAAAPDTAPIATPTPPVTVAHEATVSAAAPVIVARTESTASAIVESPPPTFVSAAAPLAKRVAKQNTVAAAPTVLRPEAAKNHADARCASIEERIQLGENMDENERTYFAKNCR
jgi:tRNA A-37 threonylcarbamoyl transferase component Bud32